MLSIYGHWKRRPEIVLQMSIEGEVEGKARPGRRKTGWIDKTDSCTEGGVAVAREKVHSRIRYDRDYGNKTTTIVKQDN